MKNQFLRKMIVWSLTSVTSMLISLCAAAHETSASKSGGKDLLAVGMIGVQHIGDNFNISEFYVDGQWAGNVGREGGGGGNVCCVVLPVKWRPGLIAEIRWSIADWSNEKEIETRKGNYQSVVWKNYKAVVPIEKYESPEDLYIHFFAGGKVRAVSSIFGSEGGKHPIQRGDANATVRATTGHVVASLFTAAELAEMKRKSSEEATKEGNWK
ncbi:DUF3304 domain-containing protein [Oxalobacteraceae bacterium OTU3CAMAD1]|nr:DUF3304 domain-containing protein [Oxalobacteraceae bacterium OTU3CAMAD1]